MEEVGPKLRILHVLTLNGKNGEYGGPVRVAREMCTELNKRGFSTQIFSGSLKNSEPITTPGLKESYIFVKPLLKQFPISSLWNLKLGKALYEVIKDSDIVHIHFARDLISYFTAIISIMQHKEFVTQTHGMVISDGRISTRIVDMIFTKPLLKKSKMNFVLTPQELEELKKIKIFGPNRILRNGISRSVQAEKRSSTIRRVVFCSRLDRRKGVDKFIDLAEYFKNSKIKFEIYGTDFGELTFIENEIKNRKLFEVIQYRGALEPQQVQEMLKSVDLLVLPSKNEPYPMIVLESLAVGTPAMVMPSCGIAETLKKFDARLVAKSEDSKSLILAFSEILSKDKIEREIVQDFCKMEFSIEAIIDELVKVYSEGKFKGIR